jgi:hypothetical protein
MRDSFLLTNSMHLAIHILECNCSERDDLRSAPGRRISGFLNAGKMSQELASGIHCQHFSRLPDCQKITLIKFASCMIVTNAKTTQQTPAGCCLSFHSIILSFLSVLPVSCLFFLTKVEQGRHKSACGLLYIYLLYWL